MEKIEIRDLRQKEQFILDDAFLNGYAKHVGIYAVGVYCSLCRHANKEQTSWPSIETIGEELAIGRDSVLKAIKALEEWGIVVKVRVGKMANNRYILTNKKTWKPKVMSATPTSPVGHTDFMKSLTPTSNSKETGAKEAQPRFVGKPTLVYGINPDGEELPKKEKDPLLEKAAKYWHSLCREHFDQEPSGGIVKSKGIIKIARKAVSYVEIKQMMDAWFDEQTLEAHEMIQITRCLSSFQIDKFKSANV